MRKINLIFLVVVTLFTSSCKENDQADKENSQSKNENNQIKKNVFIVEMNITNKEKDVICLYYKDNTISYFNNEMAIYKNNKKNENSQSIVFELPEGFLPNDFRFDLSHENEKQSMIVNNIKFNLNGEGFEIKNFELDKFFTPNEGVVFSETNRSYSFKRNADGNYDPFLTTTGQFYPFLEKLVGIGAFQPAANIK